VRGDANDDRRIDISDAIAVLGFLFLGAPAKLDCQESADADGSGRLDLSDGVYLVRYQFLGGPAPLPPFPTCGQDPRADDSLTCERFAGCP
jgi:hypothetical protein